MFKRQYYKMNLNKIITNEKLLNYLISQLALRKIALKKYYYKDCTLNINYKNKEL